MAPVHRLSSLLLVFLTLVAGGARADYYLIVQAGNTQPELTQKEALDLFMGRRQSFPVGDYAVILDLARGDPARSGFYRSLTGLSLAQVNSYWARLMFSGQRQPPRALADESVMVQAVLANPHALGWVTHVPTEPGLRTVLVLKAP